jgi:GTPase SAR1 family protein
MKIVVVGPTGSGKTTISNFLAGSKDSLVSEKYSPTIGVRILELEVKNEGSNDINVELWDASGDTS